MNPQLEPFFEQSMDCLCIAHYDGHFVKINPAFMELLGYSYEELSSKMISEFIHPEDRERTAAHRERLKNNVPLINFENRYVCKSGEIVWLHWTSIPMEREQLIYAIAKDITHTKKLESERKTQLSRLSEVNEKLKQQTYSTSHDLRSPLNNLISLVNLIDMSKIEDADNKEILGLIKLSAEGLKTTMNSYIESFKENDHSEYHTEDINFNAIFLKVQNSISTLTQKANAKFHLNFTGLENIHFNSTCMESIFLNLITNSIKYAKPGISPNISIISEVRDGQKRLTYSDNGLGMDLEKVGHRIFQLNEKFHHNEDSQGVGLYLVHSQISRHGGQIEVDSTLNEGTTFTIRFRA
ncbi:PAS domain-containing sensor histidine kinase [Allomuricauda sp. M10]|uniref:PAS domain-containing sensor histidine kinase n=1 Tax=Allomuricauda sp. M10 TaxID=2683292 RepID=UPI001D188B16|nr:PAS domain-containing sensor histidine kinase [Muricauda sp. M10]